MFVLAACGDPVADELELYVNEELNALAELEEDAVNAYNRISEDDELETDEEIYVFLQDDVIPMYKEFVQKLEAVTFDHNEIREVHEIYIDAANVQHNAMLTFLTAIEEGDYDRVVEANELLTEGRKGIRDFQSELDDLLDEHGLELEVEE